MAGERVFSQADLSLEEKKEEVRIKTPFKIAGSGVWNAGVTLSYLVASGALTREAIERGVLEDVDSRKAMIIFGATFVANLSTLAVNTVQSIRMTNNETLEAGQNFSVTLASHGIKKWIPRWSRFRNETLMAGVLAPTVVKDGALVVGSLSYEHALTAAIATNVVGTVFNTVQAVGSEGILRRVRKGKKAT